MAPSRKFPDTQTGLLASTTGRKAGPIRLRCGRARERGIGWPTVLCSIIMAGALDMVDRRTAYAGPDACTVVGNAVTCAGNQSAGIDAGADFPITPGAAPILHVNNLTGDIAPTSLRDGIRWARGTSGYGPIKIISDTGSFAIRSNTDGFNLADPGGDAITLVHRGNIFAGVTGIRAESNGSGPTGSGPISIGMVGDIHANDGISALSIVRTGNGNAGAVSVSFTGNITASDQAISAKSIVSQGNGDSGAVTIESNGSLSGPIRARSEIIQGNGNSGAISVTHSGSLENGGISATSQVGWNGNSGTVNISNNGNITGDGIFATSLVGGFGDAGAVSINTTGDIDNSGRAVSISALSRAVTGGQSGSVTVTNRGNLADSVVGIEASSMALYENAGAVVVSNTGDIASKLAIFGSSITFGAGSAGPVTITNIGNVGEVGAVSRNFENGNAGVVSVSSTGTITSNTSGIVALSQSATGNAGAVTVVNSGNISSNKYHGISAASLSDTGSTADVSITSSGNVTAGQVGVFAQSAGDAGSGNIRVKLDNGTIQGGTGAAVVIDGAASTLTIGANASLWSLSGVAIAGGGDHAISNSGKVTGNLLLGNGTNSFDNLAGALFNSGSIAYLDSAGLLANAGTFAPGGSGTAPITTTLTGNYLQTAGGSFAVDIGNGTADRVNVSGTANLAGTVVPTLGSLLGSARQFIILSAAGGVTNNGLSVKDTLLLDYELLYPNANDVVLAVNANFTPAGAALTPNQRVTAAHLQGAFGAGGGSLDNLFGYLGGFADIPSYAAALDRLHAEPYLAPVKSTLLGSLGFTDSLMSCPVAAAAGTNAFIAEGECAWARMGGRELNVDRTSANIGYQDKTWSASAGAQFAIAPDWFASLAAGYESSNLRVDNRAAGNGDVFHIGAAAKYIRGNWQISTALTGGHAVYDMTRFSVMPGVSVRGDLSLSFIAGRARTAYVFGSENAYVKPMFDLDAVALLRGGIMETGGGPVGLNVARQTDVLLSAAPAVEVGGRLAYANGLEVRPFARAGIRAFSEADLTATASFIGSPAGIASFTVTTPLDPWIGEVSAGIDMISSERFDARLSYDGRYGENTTQHGGNVKLRAKF
jgi:Autotransporter beta-domain